MKLKIGENYITQFISEVPECNLKPFMCKHTSCKLWGKGYRVSLHKTLGVKYLVWEQPTVIQPSTQEKG